MTTASLVESISVSGFGSAAASGTVYFYLPGTAQQTTVYKDGTAQTIYQQPVSLDAAGRSLLPVFATGPVRMQVFAQGGTVPLVDMDQENVVTASQVAINNANFTTTSSLDSYLTSQVASFGAGDNFVKMPGATTVSRTLQTKLAEANVSVKDFGAKGDGRNDDTGAIQAALDYVKSAGGGEVFFPSGTYVLTSGLVYTGSSGSALKLTGSGKTSVLSHTGSAITMITITTVQTLSVRGLSMLSASSLDTGFAVTAAGAGSATSFSECYGTGFPTAGTAPVISFASSASLARCSVISCVARDVTDTAIGRLFVASSGLTDAAAVSCAGDFYSTLTTATFTLIACTGRAIMANTSGFSSGANWTIIGGLVSVVTSGPTPAVYGTSATTSFVTDNAVDYLFTIGATGAVSFNASQSMIILKGNLAGITVTWTANAPFNRTAPPMVVRFWNNTGGAVTWTLGGGATLRAAAPAPAAGNSVYITFIWDSVAASWIETART